MKQDSQQQKTFFFSPFNLFSPISLFIDIFAFIWLLVLWGLILLLIINAKKVNKITFYLLLPYLLWVTFAGYLNLSIAILN